MTVLQTLADRINQSYSSWTSASPEIQKDKINLIMPVIQVAGYLRTLHQISGNAAEAAIYDNIMVDFRNRYGEMFGHDLGQTGISDVSSLSEIINEGQRRGASELSQRTQLLQYHQKYLHANNRAMYNYGDFVRQIFTSDKLTQTQKDEITAGITSAMASENPQEVRKALVELNKKFNIEPATVVLPIDDLENHALLNQLSNWFQHISEIPTIMLDDAKFRDARDVLSAKPIQKHFEIERTSDVTSETAAAALSNLDATLAAKGMDGMVGIETEFLVTTAQPLPPLDQMSPAQRNIAMKTVLADINSRGYMQQKYGLPRTVPVIENNNPFFERIGLDEVEAEFGRAGVISREDYAMIHADLTALLDEQDIQGERREQILEKIISFTPAETLFYKTFFLAGNNIAFENKIEMDDVSSLAKTESEAIAQRRSDLAKSLDLIEQGRFQEKALDMIEASEVSFGPFVFSDLIAGKNQAISSLRELAKQGGTRVDNPNTQLNISFRIGVDRDGAEVMRNIFMPKIVGQGVEAQMFSNALARDIAQIVQQEGAKAAETSGILRNQTHIGTTFDRKKTIGAKPGSLLWAKEGEHQQDGLLAIDPTKAGFLNHKILAAKTDTIRISVISYKDPENADGIGVLEFRLVTNNPHFARNNNSQRVDSNGIDFIPEELMQRIATAVTAYVASKSKEELQALVNQDVRITKDGKFEGLEATPVLGDIKRDNPFDIMHQRPTDQYTAKLGSKATEDLDSEKPKAKVIHRAAPQQLQTGKGSIELF